MSAKKPQTTPEFPGNKLLAALGGPHERNFARLEQALSVRISSRGNLVAVEGAARDRAAAILKALYARLGEDSRMVVTGDRTQSGLPGGRAEGLDEALEILEGMEGVGIARFSEADVVRHALVGRIAAAYNKKDSRR